MTSLMMPEEMLLYPLGLPVKPGDQTEEADDENIIESNLDGNCQTAKAKFSTVSRSLDGFIHIGNLDGVQ
jgi:hypothetical protein